MDTGTLHSHEANKRKKKKLVTRLKNKYRLVVMNDETFEEKVSFRLSPLNVFVAGGTIMLTLITALIYIIAFTPLREYIPGYADVNMQRTLRKMAVRTDSLVAETSAKDSYIKNLQAVINGTVGEDDNVSAQPSGEQQVSAAIHADTMHALPVSLEDSLLRAQIEAENQYQLSLDENKSGAASISSFFFFSPVKGTITNTFDASEQHYGIDLVAPKNEAVKATLDGTIVMATWTPETGNVIAIQHSNNLLSVYKHNSVLLKKTGTYVKAGEAIAIIGDSGELSTGPHLHFELWYNGTPVNPKDFMMF